MPGQEIGVGSILAPSSFPGEWHGHIPIGGWVFFSPAAVDDGRGHQGRGVDSPEFECIGNGGM
jgi:hypothetical protein